MNQDERKLGPKFRPIDPDKDARAWLHDALRVLAKFEQVEVPAELAEELHQLTADLRVFFKKLTLAELASLDENIFVIVARGQGVTNTTACDYVDISVTDFQLRELVLHEVQPGELEDYELKEYQAIISGRDYPIYASEWVPSGIMRDYTYRILV